MLEREMDIWDAPPDAWIGIPTNGTVEFDGRLVMGRGVASQARARYCSLDFILGRFVQSHGNIPYVNPDGGPRLFTFPVKTHWRDSADLELIKRSALALHQTVTMRPDQSFYLPRPGCGNGRLLWSDVKPVIEFLPDSVIVVHKNLPTLVEVHT